MSERSLSRPQLDVNGLSVNIVPNSLSFTEGGGEQSVKAQSAGGAQVSSVYSQNAETQISMLKFEMFVTDINVALARIWKFNLNNNILGWSGGSNSNTVRILQFAALTNDYEVEMKNEGIMSLEFHGEAVI